MSLANSEDPDEMPHDAAFHQGLHYWLRQNDLNRKKYNFYLEIITCGHLIYTMDHPYIQWTIPRLLNQSRRKNPLVYQPRHEISNNVVCATSKGSDQPAHMRSLIRAFASRLNIL